MRGDNKHKQTSAGETRDDEEHSFSLSGVAVVVVLVNWMEIKEKMTDYALIGERV